jgi:uncharacterized protein (TIGR02996 family)
VSERLDHAPIEAKTMTERNARWHSLAAKKSALDVGKLLATPWPKKWQDGTPMMEALEELSDDPRIAMALARIVEATPTDSWASYAFYQPILRVVARTGDSRAKLILAADLAKEKSRFWNARNRGLVVDAHAELDRQKDASLNAGEEMALAALEARFTTEFKVAKATARSEADFLAAIWGAPDDDTPRAVYADWLTERGDVRGELITLQLTPSPTPAAKKRIWTLLKKHGKAWAGPFDRFVTKEGRHFTRGFLSHVVVESNVAKAAVAQTLAHPEWALIESLSFGYGNELCVRELLTKPWRKNLRALHGISPNHLAALAELDRLEELHLRSDRLDDHEMRPTAPGLAAITKLKTLIYDTHEETLVADLAQPIPPKLERLIVVQWIAAYGDIADAAHTAKLTVPILEVRREPYDRLLFNNRFELRRDKAGRYTRLRAFTRDDETVHPVVVAEVIASFPQMTELVVATGIDDWSKESLAKVKRAIGKVKSLKTLEAPWVK